MRAVRLSGNSNLQCPVQKSTIPEFDELVQVLDVVAFLRCLRSYPRSYAVL